MSFIKSEVFKWDMMKNTLVIEEINHIRISALNKSLPLCCYLLKETLSTTEVLLVRMTSFMIRRSTCVPRPVFRQLKKIINLFSSNFFPLKVRGYWKIKQICYVFAYIFKLICLLRIFCTRISLISFLSLFLKLSVSK